MPAERLTGRARAVFDADYAQVHLTHAYATTVHSAQGTADAARAILGESTTLNCQHAAPASARPCGRHAHSTMRQSETGAPPTPKGKAVDGMDAAMPRSRARATDHSRTHNCDSGIEL